MSLSLPVRSSGRTGLSVGAVTACALLALGAVPIESANVASAWEPFAFLLDDSRYGLLERIGLLGVLLIAGAALFRASRLAHAIYTADPGTKRMQEIARAVREGADAYLARQFRTVGVLIVLLTLAVVLAKWPWSHSAAHPAYGGEVATAIGRGAAFLIGSIFSALVGFIGMRLATAANVRVAAAARSDFGTALRLAYQAGTVTGLLTAGLGLLGGGVMLLIFGDKAFQTLLGFGFGCSLLALFMRVGGGIYTKAADVGADLVGKIEADIPEDDPRNAATIADNVGDNVGDCAGMAADVFESYSVTMVAAMLLGFAAFGPKAMLFPLLVQGVGILAGMFSTGQVGKGMATGDAATALAAVNTGFRQAAGLATLGFLLLGLLFLRSEPIYLVEQALQHGLASDPDVQGFFRTLPGGDRLTPSDFANPDRMSAFWRSLDEPTRTRAADTEVGRGGSLTTVAQSLIPLKLGLDMRPALACAIGVLLALGLLICTQYWTSTEYDPVKQVAESSKTGHATNIIAGLALGYESAVWTTLLIAAAIIGAVFLFQSTDNPLFIAYGVALVGTGMLSLTVDTLSMDVFGPIADNANGIGEMGFNRDADNRPLPSTDSDFIPDSEVTVARQTLADLDAVGNTTKAVTKGIAIGSAVIAAVSLFAGFIAVLSKGEEERISELTTSEFRSKAGLLTVADTEVFLGMLLGAAVPMLFSAMTIRAVGRAAFLIVNECRQQFGDPAIRAGTKKPDYGRVVGICTGAAQRELIGPGLLAIFSPIVVGFLLGPYALGGFLAGMIVTGQLLAVFMANAGGAWDNAKKLIEDQPKSATSGKGSESHKASVTGDTVGDPLKDTAGPAINPLLKVMNMVGLLILPLVLSSNLKSGTGDTTFGILVVVVGVLTIAWAWRSAQTGTRTPER